MDRRTLLAIALIFTLTMAWSKLSRQWYGNSADNIVLADSTQVVSSPGARTNTEPLRTDPIANSTANAAGSTVDVMASDMPQDFLAVPEKTYVMETDLVRASFSSHGGRLTSWLCLKYPGPDTPYVELVPGPDEFGSVSDADVLMFSRRELPLGDVPFVAKSNTQLPPDGSPAELVMTARTVGGAVLTKTLIFRPDDYAYDVTYGLTFDSTEARTAFFAEYGEPVSVRYRWRRGITNTEELVSGMVRSMPTFRSFAMVGDEVHILNQKDLGKGGEKSNGNYRGTLRFAGIQNKYFVNLGYVANAKEKIIDGRARLGGDPETMHQAWEIELPLRDEAGTVVSTISRFIGPSDYNRLRTHNSFLERTVNLGWKWIQPVSELMLGIMNWLHKFIPNYGWVIVAISILSKLVFYPLTQRGTRAMKNMQESQARLKPKMDALKSKCGSDSQRYNQELMKLYKEEGVNPMAGMAGCLPMLIQMPVFIALYQVLYNMVDLRMTPFIFWISDLSRPDALFVLPFTLPLIGSSFNLLPIIMAIATWAQTKLTPQTGGGGQMAAMNNIMPVMMLFFLYNMPSGLVIYWTINTAMTAFQSWTVNRSAVTAGGASA